MFIFDTQRQWSNFRFCSLPLLYPIPIQYKMMPFVHFLFGLLFCNFFLVIIHITGGFPTGRDSATFQDIGTEVSLLSLDKGTTGKAQNLAMGRDGPGQPVKIWDGTRDGTITIFLSKSRTGQGRDGTITMISCFRTFFF